MTRPEQAELSPEPGNAEDFVDVAVVGGGLAGLGAALTLGRARRSVLVIDAGRPRNVPAAHSHGYLTRDGTPPLELLRLGRQEVSGYGGRIIEGTVEAITRLEDGRFRLTTRAGTSHLARRVLVTTGLVDEYPRIPGLHERWGRDVVHCPYCFGWEHRDRALAVLGTGPGAVMQALMWRQWSQDVVLFQHTAPEPTEQQRAQLAARGVTVVPGEVESIEVSDDRVTGVRLASGEVHAREVIVIGPRFQARHELLDPLGVKVVEHPFGIGSQVEADPSGFTGVPGVWVAGNVLDVTAGVMQSAASGVTAAAALNADLTVDDAERAVRASMSAMTQSPHPAEPSSGTESPGTESPGTASPGTASPDAERYWEERYRDHARFGRGRPNAVLADLVAGEPVGIALDLGSGLGGDAVWLARQGWHVTAVDVSPTALAHVRADAADAGLGSRVRTEHHDLGASFPLGRFDLVSAQYLQSPIAFPRQRVLRQAAQAVAPGGLLLIVEHASVPPWGRAAHRDVEPPTAAETLASLALDGGEWTIELAETRHREATGPNGEQATVDDNVIAARRRPVT